MIGIMDEAGKTLFIYGDSEKELLENFWDYVQEHQDTYIGFNCLTFDWVYIFKRSIICGVKPYMPFRKMMLDLRNVLDSNYMAKGTLQGICMLISGEHKFDGIEGEQVIKLWYDKDIDTLQKYLQQDLSLTKTLYNRLHECGVI
jgi:DNA polymerase elongation subunit (family B)